MIRSAKSEKFYKTDGFAGISIPTASVAVATFFSLCLRLSLRSDLSLLGDCKEIKIIKLANVIDTFVGDSLFFSSVALVSLDSVVLVTICTSATL